MTLTLRIYILSKFSLKRNPNIYINIIAHSKSLTLNIPLHCQYKLSLFLSVFVASKWEARSGSCWFLVLLSNVWRMCMQRMKKLHSRRPWVWTLVGWAERSFPRALCSEQRRQHIKSKEWPTRRVVGPAFGIPSLKFPVQIKSNLHINFISLCYFNSF